MPLSQHSEPHPSNRDRVFGLCDPFPFLIDAGLRILVNILQSTILLPA